MSSYPERFAALRQLVEALSTRVRFAIAGRGLDLLVEQYADAAPQLTNEMVVSFLGELLGVQAKGIQKVQPEDEKSKKKLPRLPLKKIGGVANVALSLGLLDVLRELQQDLPQHFEALVALSEGRRNGIDSEIIEDLKIGGFIDEETVVVNDNFLRLLKASLRDTQEGKVLVNPFCVQKGEDLKVIEWAEREIKRVLKDDRPGREEDRRPGR